MKNLQTISHRILFFTVFFELITRLGFKPLFYGAVLLSLFIWFILESDVFDNVFSGFRGALALYLEAGVIITMMVFITPSVFGIFFGFLFFRILYQYSFSCKALHIAALSGVYIGLSFIVPYLCNSTASVYESLLVVFPSAVLSFIADKFVKGKEKDMKDEIEAQQNQIDRKNKLLSTLSHELRTPLAVIKTSSEILLEERPGPLNSIQVRFLTAVRDNTARMTSLVDSILASIRVEYAWFRMKKKKRDIRPIIKKVCNDLEPFIKSRNQTIKYTYPSLLTKTVIDDNWIQQVLINLIHNASKHVGEGGRIIISVNENEQCVVVSVSDDGSGIIDDDKPKIFSEFYQGQDEGTTVEEKFDGVGLGLSIVKNVIEKHGGEVYVGSVPGKGTTLSFTLPKAAE